MPQLRIAKVNVDDNYQLTSKFGVRSLPALVLMKNCQEVDRTVGYQSRTQLKEWIDAAAK